MNSMTVQAYLLDSKWDKFVKQLTIEECIYMFEFLANKFEEDHMFDFMLIPDTVPKEIQDKFYKIYFKDKA